MKKHESREQKYGLKWNLFSLIFFFQAIKFEIKWFMLTSFNGAPKFILCIIHTWSLFTSIQIYRSLHFLHIILKTSFSFYYVLFFCPFCFEFAFYVIFIGFVCLIIVYIIKCYGILFSLYIYIYTCKNMQIVLEKKMLSKRFWVF